MHNLYAKNQNFNRFIYKPEPIMLLILPIILSTIFTHYSLFIPMLSPIVLYYSSNFECVTKFHMAADK